MSLVDAHTDIKRAAPTARARYGEAALVKELFDEWSAAIAPEGEHPGAWTSSVPPCASHARHQIVDVVDLALELLPEQQRIVVLLHDMQALSAEEICSTLGLSTEQEDVLLHRGRAALRAILDDCTS